jgi:hypothetical protein
MAFGVQQEKRSAASAIRLAGIPRNCNEYNDFRRPLNP